MRTNREQLVELSVVGEIASPTMKSSYRIHPEGRPILLPSVGGITYNFQIGSPAVGIAADHVEPGVSVKNTHEGSSRALNLLACIGNEAKVISGDGKGMVGRVTGKHGGVEHVMVHFPKDQLDRLAIGDRIQIKAVGVGLKLPDHPEITVMNLSPWLLSRLPFPYQNQKLGVHVTHVVPAKILGAGLGEDSAHSGDVDIQLFDESTTRKYHLETLRLGDFVAMMDSDHTYGRIYKRGAISIGVVTHTCSINAGHGPGVTTIFTCGHSALYPIIDPKANLVSYFND